MQRSRHQRHGERHLEEEGTPAGLGHIRSAAAQAAIEQCRVQAGAQADRQRQAGVAQGHDEGEVHELGGGEREQADLDRGPYVLSRVEARGEDFHQDHAHQPDAVCGERLAGHPGVLGGEAAVVEQCRDQRHGQHRERHGARHGKHEGDPQPPVEQPAVFRGVGARVVFRQAGQQDRAERGAQHAGRELHQAVGVVQPGDAAGDEERGEDGVDEQRDLADRHAERRRRHELEDAPHAGMAQIQSPARQQPHAREERHLEGKLQHAAREHCPGEHQRRGIEALGEGERAGDERDVEQRRGDRRHRKAVPGVQHAGRERHQRDEDDVGEGDAQHCHGQVELGRVAGEPRRGDPHHEGREQHAERRGDDQREEEQRRDAVDQHHHALLVLRLGAGEHRDEGLREGTLGEQAPQQVGDAEGDEEGVGAEARAEGARDDEVAHVAQDPADEGQARHRGQGTQQVHARIPALFKGIVLSWPTSSRRASALARRSSGATTT